MDSDISGTIDVHTYIKLKEDKNELTENEKNTLVTLKIRTESSKRILIVKLLSSNTISDLYQIIDKYSET